MFKNTSSIKQVSFKLLEMEQKPDLHCAPKELHAVQLNQIRTDLMVAQVYHTVVNAVIHLILKLIS